MTTYTIQPASRLEGIIQLPGDKSISHRYALLSAIAHGRSRLLNYSTGADCQSTLNCLAALGVSVSRDTEGAVCIEGRGPELAAPATMLDAGNSGSTIRMLSGILAGQSFLSSIGGDDSLSRRPMDRILRPLTLMGARIEAREDRFPPLRIQGGSLQPIDYTLPVASAQVKSCILLAGLYADGATVVREPVQTRDHTEIALREFGADIHRSPGVIQLHGRPKLQARELYVPGDLSSAAFFLVAALLVPGSELIIRRVGLNPTRTALLDFLVGAGASIRVLDLQQTAGELIGDLQVRGGPIRGGLIEGALTAALIDEIPVLAILGARSQEGLTVRDAAELRIKETDRIATLAENLRRMGISIEVSADGFTIPGQQSFRGATVDSFGDHRIAMAFAIAGLCAVGPTHIRNPHAASVSFPEFYSTLASLMN